MSDGGDDIGSVSFWVLKRTVDVDFNTMSKMVARKGAVTVNGFLSIQAESLKLCLYLTCTLIMK